MNGKNIDLGLGEILDIFEEPNSIRVQLKDVSRKGDVWKNFGADYNSYLNSIDIKKYFREILKLFEEQETAAIKVMDYQQKNNALINELNSLVTK